MTREEAIDDIQRHLDFYPKAGWPSRESLQMAVQALDQLDKIEHIVKERQDNRLFNGDAVFEICEVLKND